MSVKIEFSEKKSINGRNLVDQLKFHSRIFEQMEIDLTRLNSGEIKKIVYPVDFSDICSYIHPQFKHSFDHYSLSYVFDNLNREFLLLPGSVFELLMHFDYLVHKPLPEDIKTLYNSQSSEKINFNSLINVNDKISNNIEYYLETSFIGIHKLKFLINSKRIKFIGDYNEIFEQPDLFKMNNEIYERSISSINQRRKSRRTNNIVDAENFALTYSFNDSYYESNNIYFNILSRCRRLL